MSTGTQNAAGSTALSPGRTLTVPVGGMDCAECAAHVRSSILDVPGVRHADVLLAAERAIVIVDPEIESDLPIRDAIVRAGYSVPSADSAGSSTADDIGRRVLGLFGVIFGIVMVVIVGGEWLGLLDRMTERVPLWLGSALVVIGAWPVLRQVARAALDRRITAHTMMTMGVVAALAVGEWPTAAIVVLFMRVGDFAERYTTDRSRRAVQELAALAPSVAIVERDGVEISLPIADVMPGDVVVVRPGERIPVDGEVLRGQATVNQAAITGESMPVEAGPGSRVFAATIAELGSLRIRADGIGEASTFGRVIRMVEQAETNPAEVERTADRFAAWYLPVVAAVAALTLLIRRDPLAMAAVMVVACSCAFALATPIAMLASIGAAAKRGLLVKGGRVLEALARADVVFVDKTGTLTLGLPEVVAVEPLAAMPVERALMFAASAEADSEHPLAGAIGRHAAERGVQAIAASEFQAFPGRGVRASVDGHEVEVGGRRMLPEGGVEAFSRLESEGRTALVVIVDRQPVAVIGIADRVRPEVAGAIAELRRLGVGEISLLTGDNERVAGALAGELGLTYRANLLPEDKIAAVRQAQAAGRVVVMIGDGVNDAPALAQANVGIAMGAAGTAIAIEAAHATLLRDDWTLVPELFAIARSTMRVVRLNIGFTAVYNLLGLSLAAFGVIPPVVAAAAQSVPDIGILANSSRLLRQESAKPEGR